MIYEWEGDIPQDAHVFAELELPEGMSILGLVIGRPETGEAAIVQNPERVTDGGLLDADFWQDVSGDAMRMYQDAMQAWREQCDAN